jgi:hypothetical protein
MLAVRYAVVGMSLAFVCSISTNEVYYVLVAGAIYYS